MELFPDGVSWDIHVDTGGTFTDCIVEASDGRVNRTKVLSHGSLPGIVVERMDARAFRIETSWRFPDDFPVGFAVRFPRRSDCRGEVSAYHAASGKLVLASELPFTLEPGEPLELDSGWEAPILAAKLALAEEGFLLEEATVSMRLATTRCTNALLEGKGVPPVFFVTRGFRDLLRIGDQRRLGLFDLCPRQRKPLHAEVVEVPERLDESGRVLESLDLEALREPVRALRREDRRVAAVSLLHSHANAVHEEELTAFLRDAGFTVVTASAELRPFAKWLPRAESSVVEAYLAPVLSEYLENVSSVLAHGTLHVMTSAGGLVPRGAYRSIDSLLSGPAGGVVGAVAVSKRAGLKKIVALDMGGTSADVSRFDGDFDYNDRHEVGDALVSVPALRIETVAAGGGSICQIEKNLLSVGPESAGARPGPACYGYGGPLCLTDVNLLLGRLEPARFAVPVFPEEAEHRLDEMLAGTERSREETLVGFLAVANDLMACAIRKVSVREGYDPAEYALVAFGGAGGQHACGVADKLGVTCVLSPADAGLLSAYGLSRASLERFAERQVLRLLSQSENDLASLEIELREEALAALKVEGICETEAGIRRKTAFLRYQGQDAPLEIDYRELADLGTLFESRYREIFGYLPLDGAVEVVSLRVIASIEPEKESPESFPAAASNASSKESVGGFAVHLRDELVPGSLVSGPALVPDSFGTLVIERGWQARVGDKRSLLLEKVSSTPSSTCPDPRLGGVADRELFANRFLTLVDEMGAQLERTALSTNVKERLDFSCALLDADGRLVANAPHVPVHLGALGVCVREITKAIPPTPGDVIVSNHPAYGGSHLPDLTVLAPVHDENGRLFAFVANRAHHAEIGGIRPGSMSPEACNLAEEGIVIPPTHVFQAGESRVAEVARLFREGPWPSRRPEENLADLLAQIAAVRRGSESIANLAREHGAVTLGDHMAFIRERSAAICGEFLAGFGEEELRAEQCLDDGSPIVVAIKIRDGRATFDFSGTSPTHPSNLNATTAITRSAVVYVLRLLAEQDVPLNEGFLDPVEIALPEDCILAPRFPREPADAPAVAGGNVEVSQRLVDTLLLAFGRVACSQGTMNNVIFGDAKRSHYETVAGGSGAGLGFSGTSGVHVHMTNTAITDPEILELRQPVSLQSFRIREGSGGAGTWTGGDGVEREYLFKAHLSVSLLTQRRSEGPLGMAGGEAGQSGEQILVRADGSREILPSIAHFEVNPSDRLILRTPGGGGAGHPDTLA